MKVGNADECDKIVAFVRLEAFRKSFSESIEYDAERGMGIDLQKRNVVFSAET